MIVYRTASVAALWLVLLALVITQATAQAATTGATSNPATQIYVHPDKQFSLAVPASSEIIERDAPVDITVRAREGWLMHVQSAPTDATETILTMVAKLEARYVGPDLPWTVKLAANDVSVGGVPAYHGVYEGSGSRARVVILRANGWDIVMMFIAPERAFVRTEGVFDAVLASFSPPAVHATSPLSEIRSKGVSPRIVDSSEAQHSDTYRITDPAMGIALSYPTGWRVDQPMPHMLVFTGDSSDIDGRLSVRANASIQNVAGMPGGSPSAAAGAVLQEIMAQLAYSVSDVRHTPMEKIDFTDTAGQAIEARHLLSDFVRAETRFRQWSVALPRADGATVHVFTFTAVDSTFESLRPTVEAMLRSLELTEVSRTR